LSVRRDLLEVDLKPFAPVSLAFADSTRPAARASGPAGLASVARQILADKDLDDVVARARALLKSGFTAGSGYREVWIRDFATFIELSCDVVDRGEIRDNLLMFFRLQGDDGNIVDGFVPRSQANVGYTYIKKPSVPDFWGHKNTVETDQESSLIQAVRIYVRKTADPSILSEIVDGRTVLDRMESALEYLQLHRFSKKYGLLWGATTVDWGDVQPEHEWGVELDKNSHLAIDVYDNAMFLLALRDFVALVGPDTERGKRWQTVRSDVRKNLRQHLWDPRRQRFLPHLYLAGSPFPSTFDEANLYYHGGTAVAILAGVLARDEVAASLQKMRSDVKAAGAGSIGLTVYPPYPAGMFKNPSMGPYSYQNGGDWDWFGGRMIQALVEQGLVEEAYAELLPMVRRVQQHNGFYEWWDRQNNPKGSATFRGAAGVLAKAILMLQDAARQQSGAAKPG
jgi:hypothetical protein